MSLQSTIVVSSVTILGVLAAFVTWHKRQSARVVNDAAQSAHSRR